MGLIRSIIVFNSATGGDFLTSLCWSQLAGTSGSFRQEDSGRMNLNNRYFKDITTKMYHEPGINLEFDPAQMHLVENSHYWLNVYNEIADQCVFIDYPEQIQSYIMQIYLEKVFGNDKQKMLERNMPHQQSFIAKKISVDNVEKILNIHWQKNIRAWRCNSNMLPIQLADFFDYQKMQSVVCQLIGHELVDEQKFEQIYNNWLSKNNKLRCLFLDT